jgi:chromosome segregation ATPase
LNNLKEDLPEVQQENVGMQTEIADLKGKIVELGAKLKKAQEGNLITRKQLEKRVKTAEAELEAKQKTLDATLKALDGDTELAELTKQYDESLKRVQELEEEIASYDPREMLKAEVFAADASTLAMSIRNLLRKGKKDVATEALLNMPQAKRDEVTKLLLC